MPRPMYFLAIETTRRRFAEVSCSRASRPIRTISPFRSRSFVDSGTVGSKPIRSSRSASCSVVIQRSSAGNATPSRVQS